MSPTESRPVSQTFLGSTDINPPTVQMPQGKKPKPRGTTQTFIGGGETGQASGGFGGKTLIGM